MTISAELLRELSDRARGLLRAERRVVLGLVGAPGAGKSTLATALAQELGQGSDCGEWSTVIVPMDGFHLADDELVRLGRRQRKGAPDTFDVGGYLTLLRRLVDDQEDPVYAPAFDRLLDQPIAGSIAVPLSARLIITEGNYLLADGVWAGVRDLLSQAWFVHVDEGRRRQRLVDRHQKYGKPADLARSWAHGSDQQNAEIVTSTRDRADFVVHLN